MDTVRIGIVGAGDIVRQQHMPGFARINAVAGHPIARVVAVSNRTRASAEKFATDFEVPKVYDDWQAIVEDPDVDAVFIGTWPYLHNPVSIAAMDAGKHVFTQARMALSAREAKAMRAAAERSGVIAMISPSPHGLRADWIMRRLLREEYVGTLHAIHVRALTATWADPEKPYHWRLNPEFSGVNTLNIGILVEWIHRWFGPTRRIGANIKTCILERRDPTTGRRRGIIYPDIVFMQGKMTSGSLVTYEFSGVHRGAPEETITAFGSRGTIRYDFATSRTADWLSGAQADASLRPIPVPDAEIRPWRVEAEWIEAIRAGSAAHSENPTFRDGQLYMDVMEAVYHSAHNGCSIDLPLSEELRRRPVFPPEF